MKVAIEAKVLARDAQSGVYYYVQRLFGALISQDATNEYEFVYLGNSERSAAHFGLPKRAHLRQIGWFPRRLYNALLRLRIAPPIDLLAGIKPDIFIFPAFAQWPLVRTRRSIVFVHDTSYMDHPDVIQTRHFRWYLQRTVPRSITQATRVVTLSESSKASIVRHYGTDPSKISVIHPGIDHSTYKPAKPAEVARVTAAYGITKPYLLYLGTIEPRKNIARLINAYADLPAQIRSEHQLVLGGSKGWKDVEISAAVDRLAPTELIRTGFVADADLSALYSGAAMFVFPSLYEGWGMPVAEAMACGTPVITADNSSLPEVGGAAAMYVDATSENQLRDAIIQLITNPKERSRMSSAGRTHAATFSWEASAKQLHKLLDEVGR